MSAKPTTMGDLRHRVIIQSTTSVSDGHGGKASTWSTHATVWAKIEPVSANERLFAQQTAVTRTHKCVMRYRDDIDESMRVSFDSRIFQIKGIRKQDERKFFILVDLEEGAAT